MSEFDIQLRQYTIKPGHRRRRSLVRSTVRINLPNILQDFLHIFRWKLVTVERGDQCSFYGCPLPWKYVSPHNGVYTEGMINLITEEKVLWEIRTFLPLNPGMDGIIPKMLKVASRVIAPMLVELYRRVMRSSAPPTKWKKSKSGLYTKSWSLQGNQSRLRSLLRLLERIFLATIPMAHQTRVSNIGSNSTTRTKSRRNA